MRETREKNQLRKNQSLIVSKEHRISRKDLEIRAYETITEF